MKKRILLTIMFLISLSLFSNISVSAITAQEADEYNNLYYPMSIYNGGINTSPQATRQEASVDPATGAVHIQETDLTLRGRNGFDLNITRMYNSTNAAFLEATLKETEVDADVEYYMITGRKVVYLSYTDGSSDFNTSTICLTPDFMTYKNSKTGTWMVQNSTTYEYNYSSNPPISKLFTSYSEAQAAVQYLNSTTYEIDAPWVYTNTTEYMVDYQNFSVEAVIKNGTDIQYSDSLTDETSTERYSKLGAGWEFAFPYIEIRHGYEEDLKYLHFGDKGTYLIDPENYSTASGTVISLVGYDLNDIILTRDTSVTHNGILSAYCVTEKGGTKHFFGEDGRLLVQRDRYGNEIKYYCNSDVYTNMHGQSNYYPYITRIVDSVGREVLFEYEAATSPTDNSKNVTVTVTNPNDDWDKKTFTYRLERINIDDTDFIIHDEWSGLGEDDWILLRVDFPVGYRNYTYTFEKTKFSFSAKNADLFWNYEDYRYSADGNTYIDEYAFDDFSGILNVYALITEYNSEDYKEYHFEYAPFIKHCGDTGSMIFHKAVRSYEETAESFDGTSTARTNDRQYYYDTNGIGEYDGFPRYSSIMPPTGYDYAVEVKDNNSESNNPTLSTYNYTYIGSGYYKTILPIQITSQGAEHKTITDNTYSATTKLLLNTVSKEYSVADNSEFMTLSAAYTYDAGNYGDVLTETPNGDADRTVTYTYDSAYHFPLTKTYKQDANTTIREEYVPTTDGKSIASVNIYENDVLKSAVQYSYDTYGNIINQKKYINATDYIETQYTYENGANVISEKTKDVSDIDGASSDVTVSATYDYWGNPITETDANGNITRYEYDLMDRVTLQRRPDNGIKEYQYGGMMITEFDEYMNKKSTYTTESGLLKRIYYRTQKVDNSEYFYTPQNALKTEVIYSDVEDEEGNQIVFSRTEYTYDSMQRPLSKEVYDGNGTLTYKETYAYEIGEDYQKKTTTVIGGDGNPSIVTSEYTDLYGNVFKKEVGEEFETYTFDYAGNVTSVKSARANAEGRNDVHTVEYDILGNVTQETDELGNTVRNEYDRLGRLLKSYDQNNYATEYTYDELNRVIEVKTPFEIKNGTVYYSVKKTWYDDNGNVIKERVSTNAAGETAQYSEVNYTYDSVNRLIMTQTSDGEESNYVQNYYDLRGNLLRTYTGLSSPLTITGLDNVTGADTTYAVTKYTYDALDRLITSTDALNQVETNTYDIASGLLLSTTDRKGNTFTFTYNANGELLTKSLSNGTNAETTVYGLTGVPVSKQNSTSTITYTYNNKGRLVSETDSVTGATKAYTYDAAGNRVTLTVTRDGTTEMSQSYAYDKLNRLTSVSENGQVIATYTYDNKGNKIQSISNGDTTNYIYNLANMLTSQVTGTKLSETYTYYLNGNQKTKVSNGDTTTYTYDGMNRLVSENDTQYTFDEFGNRATMSDGATTTTYTYDLNNRLTGISKVSGGVTTTEQYTYDNNGNQTSKTVSGASVASYQYNCYNQLIQASVDGTTASYTYAPDGLRSKKTVGNTVTLFVYDNANIIEELCGNDTNKYYRGIGIIKNGDGLYYLYNGQGDVAMLTNAEGTVVASYTFDAYGNAQQENTVYNPFGYRGEYYDEESGLIYLRNRYYDPTTGRFINEDPIRDGLNWYVYCGNNPVNYIDPNGLSGIKPDGTYHITHSLDQELLKLKQEYVSATPERRAQITIEAQSIRNSGKEGVDWSVRADRTLNYYLIDTDVTEKLNNVIKSSESENWWKRFGQITPITNAARYVDFALMVRPGGKYDLKSKTEWQGKEHFIYNGEIIWYDEPGNILYGHLGKVMGFEDIILESAGGAVQIATNTSSWSYVSSYFDDPRDQRAVQKGIDIFKNTHSWIWW